MITRVHVVVNREGLPFLWLSCIASKYDFFIVRPRSNEITGGILLKKISGLFSRFAHSAWPELKHSKVTTELHRKSKNQWTIRLKHFFGLLDVSWVALGRLWGCLGGLLETSLGLLGPSCRPGGQEALKSSQGPPKFSLIRARTFPKEAKWDRCTPFWCFGRSPNDKNQYKYESIINNKSKIRKG